MEYHLKKKSLGCPKTLLDTVSEQPVDIDLTLPDYCPDIERILKCELVPRVYLANVSGDRLTAEGGACVRVMYLDSEKGCARSFEYTAPFSESFPLKDSPNDSTVYVDTKPEYINCRALSPRKLSLHGAFSLYARVVVKDDLCYAAYDEGDDLQVLAEELSASELCGLCSDTFSVREDVELSGQPEITAFITHRLTARITELKAISGKIMLTGEGRLELMYLSGSDSGIEQLSCAFPISRVIDCEGVGEDSVIDARLQVMTYDLSLNDDALGGSAVLSVDAKLCFNALCYEERPISLIRDAFSTERDISLRSEPFTCASQTRCLSYTDISKASVTLEGEELKKVIDVHANRIIVSAAVSGGAPLLSARMNVGILYENTDGETRCIDRDLDLSYNPSVDDIDSVDAVSATADSLSYRIVDAHTLELRGEVCYRMTVSRRISRSAPVAITADEEASSYADDDALILYYADAGESIWDIGKRFHARPDAIREENAVEGESLTADLMLLIPTA